LVAISLCHAFLVELTYALAKLGLFFPKMGFEILRSFSGFFDPFIKLLQLAEGGLRRLKAGILYITRGIQWVAGYFAIFSFLMADDIMRALQDTEEYRLKKGLPTVILGRHLPGIPLGMFLACISILIPTFGSLIWVAFRRRHE
jgi:hypothetical protein